MKTKTLAFYGCLSLLIAGCGSDTVTNGQGGGAASSSASSSSGSNGSTSSSGSGGSGAAGGAGGAATTGSGGAGGMSGAGGGSSGCGFCDFVCCGQNCTNTGNDINNCGGCGVKCSGPNPFCDNGKCGTPPCNGMLCGANGLCCGASCCKPGELCCDVPGPVGNMLGCFTPNSSGTCPTGCTSCVCTSPDTPIATPAGERPIAELAEGDLVYSVDHGAIVAVPLRKVQRVPAKDHIVMHIELEGGRVLEISPRHPTADGRAFAELAAGGSLDGSSIIDARPVAYRYDATYDILPDSDTATYFAAGALIGSTMARSSAAVP